MRFPTTPVLDTFDDASAPRDLATYNPAWSGPILSGEFVPQTKVGGTVGGLPAVNTAAYRNDISVADAEVYAIITTKPTNGGFVELAARVQNPNSGSLNCYFLVAFANAGTDSLELYKAVGGSISSVATFASIEYGDGDVLGLSLLSSQIRCFMNGVQVGSTVLDGSVTGAGSIGFRLVDNVCRLDDFGGGAAVPTAPFRSSIGTRKPIVFSTVALLDNFNRADSATLGANWQIVDDLAGVSMAIESNEAKAGSVGQNAEAWLPDTFGGDVEVSVTLKATAYSGSAIWLLAQMPDPAMVDFTGYLITINTQFDHYDVIVYRGNNGSYVNFGTVTSIPYGHGGTGIGDVLTFRKTGATLDVLINGVSVGGSYPATDGSPLSASGTYIGFGFNSSTDERVDDFTGG